MLSKETSIVVMHDIVDKSEKQRRDAVTCPIIHL